MITAETINRLAITRFPPPADGPTLGQELREVLRYLFDQPERRQRATDFVWSYEELSDDIPD